jgi:Fe-Mn family superoxide dismutase
MTMHELPVDRRGLLAGGMLLAAGSAVAAPAMAQSGAPARRVYAPEPVPLPFDPKAMPGLSEKLLTSHHANNYTSAVKRIAAINGQLAALDPATAPGFQFNGLKREELIATNSMMLHELYFANLGSSGAASVGLAAMIERDFGSMARWQAEFSGTGKALGGGSGWAVLQYQHRDKRLAIQWANDHTMSLVGGTPLLVLDMFEHAYAMDYGSKAAAYVDAFMQIINWNAVSARFAWATNE